MKSIIKFSAVAAWVLFLFASCSKPKDFTTSYLKGMMDGVAFDCDASITANKPESIPGQGDDPTLRISGKWSTYSIQLLINGEGSSIAPGTYVFQGDKNRSGTIWQGNFDSYYAGNGGFFDPLLYGSGRIIIAEIDKNYIKGSFDFVTVAGSSGGASKTVTKGEFHIKRN